MIDKGHLGIIIMCHSNQGSMTAEAVCERLCRRQFEEGQDIFAVQWSSIHRMAQTGDMRGLRCVGLPFTGTCVGVRQAT